MLSENIQVQVLRCVGRGLLNDVARYRAGGVLMGTLRRLSSMEGKKKGARLEFSFEESIDAEGDRYGHRPEPVTQGDLLRWGAGPWFEVTKTRREIIVGHRFAIVRVLLRGVRRKDFVPELIHE